MCSILQILPKFEINLKIFWPSYTLLQIFPKTVFPPSDHFLLKKFGKKHFWQFQSDGISQFSGSFAKRSYQRSLSYNELSFVDQSDFCDDENFYVETSSSNFYRRQDSNKKLDVKDFHGNRSRTPTSPNPYFDYYNQVRFGVRNSVRNNFVRSTLFQITFVTAMLTQWSFVRKLFKSLFEPIIILNFLFWSKKIIILQPNFVQWLLFERQTTIVRNIF